jgi:non-ribosomal peptide synthase protein (TIGR01720 family)
LSDAIKTIKETLRAIPYKGIGYGILRFLRHDIGLSTEYKQPTVSFNYQGQWDNATLQKKFFTLSQDALDQTILSGNHLFYPLNINAEVKENVMHIFWTYSSYHYHHHTIERISNNFVVRLKQLIKHCCDKDNFEYTQSDFELTKLSQIDVINQMINEG